MVVGKRQTMQPCPLRRGQGCACCHRGRSLVRADSQRAPSSVESAGAPDLQSAYARYRRREMFSPGSGAFRRGFLLRVLSGRAEYKITIDFTGGRQNESMLAYLFCALPTSFQPPGRSPKEFARPASHALPTPSWESTQRKIVITPSPASRGERKQRKQWVFTLYL